MEKECKRKEKTRLTSTKFALIFDSFPFDFLSSSTQDYSLRII